MSGAWVFRATLMARTGKVEETPCRTVSKFWISDAMAYIMRSGIWIVLFNGLPSIDISIQVFLELILGYGLEVALDVTIVRIIIVEA